MQLKYIYKNLFTLLGASFCLLPSKKDDLLNPLETPQEIFRTAQLEQKMEVNNISSEVGKQDLQQYIKDLNQTEIYLLVTNPSQEKLKTNILLLLHPEDRLNSEQSLMDDRHTKFVFYSTSVPSKLRIRALNKRLNFRRLLNPEENPILSKSLTTSKSYYVNNLGGYKSICPVFFDKNSAEDFLVQNSKENLLVLQDGFEINSKEVLQGILNSKIIKVGLGDFINYYSSNSNQKFLEKIDFLFFPSSQELQSNVKTLYQTIPLKGFKFYQNQYYELKS